MWKSIAHPYVTHNAIQACQMARAGLTDPERVFDGSGGFFDIVAERELRIDQLSGRDSAPYPITQAHIKPFPCGYYMQPIITGVRDLGVENDFDPGEFAVINIETFEQAVAILSGSRSILHARVPITVSRIRRLWPLFTATLLPTTTARRTGQIRRFTA